MPPIRALVVGEFSPGFEVRSLAGVTTGKVKGGFLFPSLERKKLGRTRRRFKVSGAYPISTVGHRSLSSVVERTQKTKEQTKSVFFPVKSWSYLFSKVARMGTFPPN